MNKQMYLESISQTSVKYKEREIKRDNSSNDSMNVKLTKIGINHGIILHPLAYCSQTYFVVKCHLMTESMNPGYKNT